MSNIIKPKLWIVSELFYPDQTSTSYILSKIADKMVNKYDVTVITDSALYQDNKTFSKSYFEISNDIKIIKIASKKRDKNNLLQRTTKVIFLSLKMSWFLWKRIFRGEKVLIVTNPAPLLILLSLIKKLKKINLTILVHDVFPENTIPAGIIKSPNSFFYKVISTVFNKAYSEADCLIVLGKDMKEVVKKKIKNHNKTRIEIIENWADTQNITPSVIKPLLLEERCSKDIITIQYAGNIGRAQGIENFLELFYQSSNKKLHFDLWGNGALKDKLSQRVNFLQLQKRVSFYGNYSRDQQNEILNTANIALITLAEGMYGLGVPSKTYNILAAGIPILFIGDLNSEIALLIKEKKIGHCFSNNDERGIVEFLDSLNSFSLNKFEEMGKIARNLAESKYSEDIILSKFMKVL